MTDRARHGVAVYRFEKWKLAAISAGCVALSITLLGLSHTDPGNTFWSGLSLGVAFVFGAMYVAHE